MTPEPSFIVTHGSIEECEKQAHEIANAMGDIQLRCRRLQLSLAFLLPGIKKKRWWTRFNDWISAGS